MEVETLSMKISFNTLTNCLTIYKRFCVFHVNPKFAVGYMFKVLPGDGKTIKASVGLKERYTQWKFYFGI